MKASQSLWSWQAVAFGLVAPMARPIMNDWINQSLLSLKRKAEARPVQARPLVFFNYRHSQAKYISERIYDALRQEFGEGYVFRDAESIAIGSHWEQGIDQALGDCEVVVAHIHDGWEKEIAERIEKRQEDLVREELEKALSAGKALLLPVFTSDKPDFNMTARLREIRDTLPDGLTLKTELDKRHGILLRPDRDFRQDVERLVQAVWAVIVRKGNRGDSPTQYTTPVA